jgi:CDP-glucose 4,6-dehydratase
MTDITFRLTQPILPLGLDCSKARQQLNWVPRWNLEEAIDKITEWHSAHSQKMNMHDFSLQQIASYQNI